MMKNDREMTEHYYCLGFCDRDIANKLGCTTHTIMYWRKQHNLPARASPYSLKKIKHEEALALYHLGKTDSEIAKEFDCSCPTVTQWRTRYNLQTKRPRPNFDNSFMHLTEDDIAIMNIDKESLFYSSTLLQNITGKEVSRIIT